MWGYKMKKIQFPLEYKEGTRLIKYPEADESLFKNGQIIDDKVVCTYHGNRPNDYTEHISINTTPEPVKTMSPYEFMIHVGTESMVAIKIAAKTDPVVDVFITLVDRADVIKFNEPSLLEGLAYLVQQNIIDQPEADRILAG